jgi:hypothetical protein
VKTLFRAAATFIGGIATYYFVYWVGSAAISFAALSLWIPFLASALAAIAVARYIWVHTASVASSLVSSIVVGALITGGVAFSAGFFGPIFFAPGANQGPLLGILITGPLGFLIGAIGGAIYWFARKRRSGTMSNDDAA